MVGRFNTLLHGNRHYDGEKHQNEGLSPAMLRCELASAKNIGDATETHMKQCDDDNDSQ